MDKIQEQTENFMNEYITNVQSFHQKLETYKHEVGCKDEHQTYSDKFADKFTQKFMPDLHDFTKISDTQNIPLDKIMYRMILHSFVSICAENHPDNPLVQEFYKQKKEQALKNKEQLNQQMIQIYHQIPQEEKKQIFHEIIEDIIASRHANNKMKSEYNAPEVGYCLQSITKPLYELDKKYHYCDFLPQINDKEDEKMYAEPDVFVETMKLNPKTKNHVYESSADKTFKQLIEEHNIQKGAIIILYNKNHEGRHAMFWDGSRNEQNEPLLIGFNNDTKDEQKNVLASYTKNGATRIGMIIDTQALVKQGIKNQQALKLSQLKKSHQH